jgi:hypothetical protein
VFVACGVWPEVAAALFPVAIVVQVQAIVDSTYWVCRHAERWEPNCCDQPEFVIMPLVGNFAHAGWIVLCSLRGDFTAIEPWVAVVASLGVLLLYAVLALCVKPQDYAYALTPFELLVVVLVGCGVAVAPTLAAFGLL